MAKVAFIGLGVMGFPMAGHLAAAGHEVTVYNRNQGKAEEWAKLHGGQVAPTPAEAAAQQEYVFSCVGDDPDVIEVTLGKSGAFQSMSSETVFVDHTTASADLARQLASEAFKKGFHFLDGPVSGGQAGAENGVLTVMCGGEQEAFNRAKPLMESYGRAVTLIGQSGAGQLAKMVNQICIAGLVQGLSEGVNFGMKAGLDMDVVLGVISKGAAQSWQMENRGSTMVQGEFDFGFAVDWMRKDLRIVLQEGERNGARLPTTALIDQFYKNVQQDGGGRWDTSSLIHLLSKD
ncbi:MAG: NAD(P)-dependent oxidoreductase [Alphaproteobacteria bacterium]|jgi:3-hydroxyisobutyrate dehydrogenase